MEIKTFDQISDSSLKAQIEDIFWEASSIKKFKSDEEKSKFFYRWCGQYLEKYPQHFYLAMDEGELLGYLCWVPDTKSILKDFNIPGMDQFVSLYDDFPAHLHINFSSKARGRGLGSLMLQKMEGDQGQLKIKGVHLITSKDARNRSFYLKNGYTFEQVKDFKGHDLLFMGKKLS